MKGLQELGFKDWHKVENIATGYLPDRLLPIEVKNDKKFRQDLKGLKSFLQKEKEKAGILIGRFEDADIIEEGKIKIYLLPYWMI